MSQGEIAPSKARDRESESGADADLSEGCQEVHFHAQGWVEICIRGMPSRGAKPWAWCGATYVDQAHGRLRGFFKNPPLQSSRRILGGGVLILPSRRGSH